jgi:peptide-methionine (S)-S-oxide reductase
LRRPGVASMKLIVEMKGLILCLSLLSAGLHACTDDRAALVTEKQSENIKTMQTNGLATATFGAGCFWCVEAIFQDLKGVEKVVSGYSGGKNDNPTYREVCSGTTGHAEVIQVHFDPAAVSFETLTKVFFTTHDPTTLNRQGADTGTQYRSVIFYHDEEQKAIAERLKKDFAPTLWDDPIVTEISPFTKFFVAEGYHQNYFKDNPNQGYCRIVINPKVSKFRKMHADLIKN